jgi:ABC-type cobalamin/Fe3+-siderophores transport system ATPase subunit
MAKRLDLKDVNIYYGKFHAVSDVTLAVPPRSVTAFIGPSGCGKSTVLRSLNRMHEVTPGARVEGSVLARRSSTRSPSARSRVPTSGTRSRTASTSPVAASPADSSSGCASLARSPSRPTCC